MTRSIHFSALALATLWIGLSPQVCVQAKPTKEEGSARHRLGSFEQFIGSWDCQGTRTDTEKGAVKESKTVRDKMTFMDVLDQAWVAAEYEDQEGYLNRCYYTQLAGGQTYQQLCLSSQEGVTHGEAQALSKSKVAFTGETQIKGKTLRHEKTIERVALGALDFQASIEDTESGFRREWKALCFFRKADLK